MCTHGRRTKSDEVARCRRDGCRVSGVMICWEGVVLCSTIVGCRIFDCRMWQSGCRSQTSDVCWAIYGMINIHRIVCRTAIFDIRVLTSDNIIGGLRSPVYRIPTVGLRIIGFRCPACGCRLTICDFGICPLAAVDVRLRKVDLRHSECSLAAFLPVANRLAMLLLSGY